MVGLNVVPDVAQLGGRFATLATSPDGNTVLHHPLQVSMDHCLKV